MVKSKGSAKDPAAQKSKQSDLAVELPEIPEGNAQNEKEIPVVTPENYIFLSIGSISNIRTQLLSQESCIKFRIQFGNDFVIESPLISFPDVEDSETKINWQASVPCFTSRTEDLDFLTSNPLLVSISEEEKVIEDQDVSQPPENPLKSVEFNPFAHCTLDLFPLILGESEICQTLLLEIVHKAAKNAVKMKKDTPTKQKTPKEGKSSGKGNKSKASKSGTSKGQGFPENQTQNKETDEPDVTVFKEISTPLESPSVAQLPRISVRATTQQPILTREIVNESNAIFLTIESIYNVPRDFDGESMELQAGTLIPNEFDNDQTVHFGRGVFTREADKVRTKRWINIDNISGKSTHTHYTISEDLFPVSNKLGVDLCKVMSLDAPRIEWNKVKRSWLSSSGSEYLGDYLLKTKTWLLEVSITPRGSEIKRSMKSKGDLQPVASESMHLVAFFDVGALMYPGMQGVRMVSQLFTYCKEDVQAKCGARTKTVLSPAPTTDDKSKGAQSRADIEGGKGKKAKGKQLSKGSKNSKKEPVSVRSSRVSEAEAPQADAVCEPRPWVNEEGEPVFVIFELELMKPLVASIEREELFAKVDALIPIIPVVPEEEMAATMAGEKFKELIQKIAKKLNTKYQKFVNHRKQMNLPINVGEQITKDYYQFLKETGMIEKIKTLLADSVGVLIKDKLGYDVTDQNEQDAKAKHKFVTELYARLVEEVNTIINTLHSDTEENAKRYELPQAQMKRLYNESRKLGFSSLQEQMYLRQRNKADVGTQFVHSSQCDDLESAMEFTLDLLSHDRNFREGLLFYATLLTKKGDMKQAELFFQVTVTKHPEYMIAGYLFSLFYQMAGNSTAAELVWDRTRRCTAKLQGRHDGQLKSAYPELLDWDANVYDLKSVHLHCVELILYVRVMALDFAYLALANELEKNGPSEPYYYFLSVCRFRQREYQEACDILRAILVEKPRLNHIRRMLGHCQFEMRLREAAVENYRLVVDTSENGLSNHLVHLRLGDYYLDCEDYRSAKAIFFQSCRWTPTATSWLGVGIACYMEGDFGESERALTEANYLDRTMALVWGYLALVNLQLFRYDKFEQCYCRAMRYNLNDDKVIGRIDELVYACGFSIPKLIHFDNKDHSF